MNDVINYLIEKLEEDLTREDIIYPGNVLFSDVDRLCEWVVNLSQFFPNRSNLYKEIYRLNIYITLNWEDQHFDLVKKQTRDLIELVRKNMTKEGGDN